MAARYVLFSAVYGSNADAVLDLHTVVRGAARDRAAGDHAVAGPGILHRDRQGRLSLDKAGGATVTYSAVTGMAVGFAIGPGTPSLWGSALVGLVIGGLVGYRDRGREVRALSALLGERMPPGAHAIVAVVAEGFAARLPGQLDLALATMMFPIDAPERAVLAKSLARGNTVVTEALDEQDPRPEL